MSLEKLHWSSVQATEIRIPPGDDLKPALMKLATDYRLQATAILTAVGSLSAVSLRLANSAETTEFQGKFEIVSLVGTLSEYGAHLHMTVADSRGTTLGGHVMAGSTIYTTAEIVLAELGELRFTRQPCPLSGYQELTVGLRNKSLDDELGDSP